MRKSYKRCFGAVLMTVGLILIIAASCFMAYNIWDERRAARVTEDVADWLYDAIPDTLELDAKPDSGEMPEFELDSSKYIALLEVPTLGLVLPVMSEWSYPNLRISPCRYSGSAYTNDLVIAAHNYKSHFGGLRNLKAGDKVILTDMDGNMFTYSVAETETVVPTEIDKMKTGDWDLTMFTCNYSGRARVAVRCRIEPDE